jgi:hypothetical protein
MKIGFNRRIATPRIGGAAQEFAYFPHSVVVPHRDWSRTARLDLIAAQLTIGHAHKIRGFPIAKSN